MGATTIAITAATVASSNAIIAANNSRLLAGGGGAAGDINPAMAIMIVMFIAVAFVGGIHAADAKWDRDFYGREKAEWIRYNNKFVMRTVWLVIALSVMAMLMIILGFAV